MKKFTKRMMSLLLVIVMIASFFAVMATTTSAASYTYNSGKRGTVCTSLSSNAKSYWSGSYAYSTLKTKAASTLRTTLRTKISSGSTVGYNGLRTYMKYSDAYQGSTSKLMLFYSSGSTTSTWDSGKSWNREHMWPQSLGGNAVEGDLHAMRPTDPTANSSRGNHKYGEVASGYTTFKTSSKNGSLVCGYYKSDIFEPLDNVKGDCARVVLYDYVKASSMSSVTKVFSSASTLLTWCKNGPVDTFEMSRNDAVQSIQGNRNPFIDYPELGWVVLGSSIPSGMTTPSGGTSSSSSNSGSNSGNTGSNSGNTGSNSGSTGSTTTTTSGTGGTYTLVTSTSGLTSGGTYVIVSGGKVFNASLSTLDAANNYVTANTSGSNILANSKYAFTLTKSGSYYTIKAASGKYIGRSSNANGMNSSSTTSYNNTISFNSNGTVNIKGTGGAYLRFNATSGQMRFRYFKSSAYSSYNAIYLYKLNGSGSSTGSDSGNTGSNSGNTGSNSGSTGSGSTSSSSTTFNKITSTSAIGSGKYILLVKAGGAYKGSYSYYILTRQATNTSYVLATGQNWSSVPTALTCDPSSTLVWTGSGSASGWKLSNGSSSVLRASSNSLYYGSGTATSWKVTYTSGYFKLSYSSRYLGLRDDLSGTGSNGCPRFRCSSTASTSSYQFYIYKQA